MRTRISQSPAQRRALAAALTPRIHPGPLLWRERFPGIQDGFRKVRTSSAQLCAVDASGCRAAVRKTQRHTTFSTAGVSSMRITVASRISAAIMP